MLAFGLKSIEANARITTALTNYTPTVCYPAPVHSISLGHSGRPIVSPLEMLLLCQALLFNSSRSLEMSTGLSIVNNNMLWNNRSLGRLF